MGLGAWDRLLLFDTYPHANQKVECLASAATSGGPVPTALIVFAKLGGRAAFCGAVGDDYEGELFRSELQQYGVNLSHLMVRPGRKTPCAHIWVDRSSGERTVALDRGEANPVLKDELPQDLLKETPLLLMDGREVDVCLLAGRLCREGGGQVVLDAGSPRPRMRELLTMTDHAVVSSDFVRGTYPGLSLEQAAQEILSGGAKAVVITCGEQGGYWREGGRSAYYPAFPVEVLDTTGAGDAFHGAYLYGLGAGWDLPRCCRFASAVAALTCRALGGHTAAPTSAEIQELMQAT